MALGRTKAEMLESIPSSELPYWAALLDIKAQERIDEINAMNA